MIGPESELTASLAAMTMKVNKKGADNADVVESEGIESPPAFSRLNSVASMKSIDSRMSFQGIALPDSDDDQTMEEREANAATVIAEFTKELEDRTRHHLGYPYNLDFDYGALAELQRFSINNLGDPFVESNYGVHSRAFEVGVLDWFAKLWEIEPEEYWGYITNCGTEGNLHGILVGREVLPDGVLYASKETHYSVFKAARMYRMDLVKVNTLVTGELDLADFRKHLEANRGRPAIVNINVGTTVKGAVDDLDGAIKALYEAGYTDDRFYIHCDGALFGLMIPFVRNAPQVTFNKPIGSVSVSGHKFIGCPMPCGVVITRREHMKKMSQDIEYLASKDATIMGSRNGHAAVYMWYTLNRKGYVGIRKDTHKCVRNAHLLKSMLHQSGVRVMLNELSSTVVFERPEDEEFVRKWQLACEGPIAHAVVMPNITPEVLKIFVSELTHSRKQWMAVHGKPEHVCLADVLGAQNCMCESCF